MWTLNRNFKNTYIKFLMCMVDEASSKRYQGTKGTLIENSVHKMMMVQYLQLQDRVGEAIKVFEKIKEEELPKDGSLKIQYDYMRAYFDFFTG